MADQLSADVVVIGSGICGCLAAERLARSGRSVLILEAGPRVTRNQLVLNYRSAPQGRLDGALSAGSLEHFLASRAWGASLRA